MAPMIIYVVHDLNDGIPISAFKTKKAAEKWAVDNVEDYDFVIYDLVLEE